MPAAIQRAANQYLQTNKFIVVVTGDLSKIEKPVRNQDLAPVTIIDPATILK
jgi:hypothetical protein